MRKLLVLVISVALLGACKSDSKDVKAAPSSGPSSSSSGIRAKVLTEADLPPGFKRTSLDIDKRDLNPIGCAALDNVDTQYVGKTAHTIEAAFQNGDDDTATQFLDEQVYEFKTVEDANGYFDGEAAGLNACKTFSSTEDEGSTTSGSIQPYAFPPVGDESMAATFTIDGQGAGPGVIVRKGTSILLFTAFHVGSQPGLTGAEVEAIVRKGADKL